MPTIEVMTVSDSAPHLVVDRVLTAAEQALNEVGASRVWLDRTSRAVTVMADLPSE